MKFIANPVEVEAYVIEAVDGPHPLHGGQLLRTEVGQMLATDAMLARYMPVPGDYVVVQSDGYTYVNPKKVFERKYSPNVRPCGLGFGDAIAELKVGRRVARAGWNGKGMFLVLVPGSTITPSADRPLGIAAPELVGKPVPYQPHIDMFTAQGTMVPWLASQSDVLAEDWVVL